MTLSDKIRIYELSRDLNLENKDILDAAQKLSISVKSHSSSISFEDAKKIKIHLNNNVNKSKNILSVNKAPLNSQPQKNKAKNDEEISKNLKSTANLKNKNPKGVKPVKPLLTKPIISKFKNKENISKKVEVNSLKIISTTKTVSNQKNKPTLSNGRLYEDKAKVKNKVTNKNEQLSKPPKPTIQLIEKPKNVNRPPTQATQTSPNKLNNTKSPKISRFENKSLKNNPNISNSSSPELVGAPIRKANLQNKQCKIL